VPTLIDPNSSPELLADGLPQSTEGLVIDGSAGILVYLALKYAPSWYDVSDPIRVGRINNWLSFAANEIHHSLLKVRVSLKFGWDITPLTYPQAVIASHKTLSFLNNALEMNEKNGQNWLVNGSNPSIADIAVFPYVAFIEHSSDNAIQLSAYPAVLAWIERFKALPNFFMDNGAFF
jgi:glutathione S-transferase